MAYAKALFIPLACFAFLGCLSVVSAGPSRVIPAEPRAHGRLSPSLSTCLSISDSLFLTLSVSFSLYLSLPLSLFLSLSPPLAPVWVSAAAPFPLYLRLSPSKMHLCTNYVPVITVYRDPFQNTNLSNYVISNFGVQFSLQLMAI